MDTGFLTRMGIRPDLKPGVRVAMGRKASSYADYLRAQLPPEPRRPPPRPERVEDLQAWTALHGEAAERWMAWREATAPQLAEIRKLGGGVHGRDCFWLVAPAEGRGKDATSALHPAYDAWNYQPAERRRRLRGNLVAHVWYEPAPTAGRPGADRWSSGCCWSRYDAQTLPDHAAAPGLGPTCTGDGATARRWVDGRWQTLPCPGDLCHFRQKELCKRGSTLVFQLRWEDGSGLPSALTYIEGHGPYSFATAQWWGFYKGILQQWQALGGHGEPPLYGLPIALDLQVKTVPSRGSRFYVPTLSLDLPPGLTLQSWLAGVAQQRAAAGNLLTGAPSAEQIARGYLEGSCD